MEALLPSGFHDALLHSYEVDLVAKTAKFRLELSVGDPESADESIREAYRGAYLALTGLEYLIVEPPDGRYARSAPWQIDLCEADVQVTSGIPLPDGAFTARFYSSDTNSFIHFAATAAEIRYDGAAHNDFQQYGVRRRLPV